MPYRHARRPGMAATFAYFAHHNIDVLCLQELNSARMGPIMYCVWRLCLLLPLLRNSAAMEYIEYLAVAEGLLLPLVANDNRSDLVALARQYGYQYHAAVHEPRYYLDCGLLILSRYPVDVESVEVTYLPRDAGNRPGILAATVSLQPSSAGEAVTTQQVRLYNLHFVPTLLSVTPVFRLLNGANRLLGRDTRRLRQRHLTTLISDIQRRQRADERLMVVIGGDFNVTYGSEEEKRMSDRLLREAGLHCVTMQPRRATACERTFAHEGQVDYIVACSRVMQRWRRSHSHSSHSPTLACACHRHSTHSKARPDGDDRIDSNAAANHAMDGCTFSDVLHVWPTHEADRLHSTRVDSMFSSVAEHTHAHTFLSAVTRFCPLRQRALTLCWLWCTVVCLL